ncbi:hypothetical protein AX16_008205 [Volvariella volvacea WC 439]|nr:hypothetical protein AX16_008205 [Volvariella volvacea WC 439]
MVAIRQTSSVDSEREPPKEGQNLSVGQLWRGLLPTRSSRRNPEGMGPNSPSAFIPSSSSLVTLTHNNSTQPSIPRRRGHGAFRGASPSMLRKKEEPTPESASVADTTPLFSPQSPNQPPLCSSPATKFDKNHWTESEDTLSPSSVPSTPRHIPPTKTLSQLRYKTLRHVTQQQSNTISEIRPNPSGSSLSPQNQSRHGLRTHRGNKSRRHADQGKVTSSSESEDTEVNSSTRDPRKPSLLQITLRGLIELSFGTFRLLLAKPSSIHGKTSSTILCTENPIKGNEALWLAVCQEVCELEAVGLYVPITLFTNHGLNILVNQMREVRSIRKISLWSLPSWFGKYVNTQHDLFQREESTRMEEWRGAATCMIRWARTRTKDDNLVIYLTQHFEWLKTSLSQLQLDFETIRDFDIQIRQGLHKARKLPSFCRDQYRKQFIDFLKSQNKEISHELRNRMQFSIISESSLIASHSSLERRARAHIPGPVIMKNQPRTNSALQHYFKLIKAQKQISESPIDEQNAVFCKIPSPPLPRLYSTKRPDILYKISTPYNVDSFQRCLEQEFPDLKDKYPYLISKLQFGFPMAREFPESGPHRTRIVPNGRSAEKNMKFIKDELEKEVAAGRMDGPFSRRQVKQILGTEFYCAPLTVDEQLQDDRTTKFRMCIDYSRPIGQIRSVNNHSDPEDFPTTYDGAQVVAEMIVDAVPGTQAMTADITKFHRQTPIAPAHKAWFVVQGQADEFYIQHCCPFGARPSEGNSGEIAAFVVDVWERRKVGRVIKWCDDFVIMRPPESDRSYDRKYAFNLVSDLKVPWHPDKGVDFSDEFPYLGLLWNIPEKSVRLKEEKKALYLKQIESFLQDAECDCDAAAKVHGVLSYVTYIYPVGRSYLSALNTLVAEFDRTHAKNMAVPPEVISDMIWWRNTLEKKSTSKSLKPLPEPKEPIGLSVANCKDGIGIVSNDWCIAWKVTPGSAFAKDRVWLAGAAIQLAAVLVARRPTKYHNCTITVQCDNKSFIEAFKKGRHRDPNINLTIREACTKLEDNNISFNLVWDTDRKALDIARKGSHQSAMLITPIALPKNLEEHLVPCCPSRRGRS